jgi:hypothetical protein
MGVIVEQASFEPVSFSAEKFKNFHYPAALG